MASLLFCDFYLLFVYLMFGYLPCSKRIPMDQWYLNLRPLLRILAKHKEAKYLTEHVVRGFDEDDDNL